VRRGGEIVRAKLPDDELCFNPLPAAEDSQAERAGGQIGMSFRLPSGLTWSEKLGEVSVHGELLSGVAISAGEHLA
jgi:hypothetical protein